MYKKYILFLLTLLIGASLNAQDTFKFLPVLEKDFQFKPALAFKSGIFNFSNSDIKTNAFLGAEYSFNCPMIRPSKGYIRPQISYNYFKDGDIVFQSIEFNPYYFYDISDNFSVGIGPGIGYLKFDDGTKSDAWAFHSKAGFYYHLSKITLGLEGRYQWQTSDDDKINLKNLNNLMINLKTAIYL